MNSIVLWSPFFVETFNQFTPLYGGGVGGSETSQVVLAEEFAKRGNKVISYAPLGYRGSTYAGVEWRDSVNVIESLPEGQNWLVYRDPRFFSRPDFPKTGKFTFLAQDTFYDWAPDELKKVNKYATLCETHSRETLRKHPELKGRIYQSSNGVRDDVISEIEKENIPRNPHRLMYASSADRGLILILRNWKRILEFVPDAELHIAYGFNVAEKMLANGGTHLAPLLSEVKQLMNQPGIHWLGRIGQMDLYREWFKSSVFFYPNTFMETSCISVMDAQATGCVPVCSDGWALGQNVLEGRVIHGNPDTEPLVMHSLIRECIDELLNPMSDEKRRAMMVDARDTFRWSKWAAQMEAIICG